MLLRPCNASHQASLANVELPIRDQQAEGTGQLFYVALGNNDDMRLLTNLSREVPASSTEDVTVK